MKRLRLTLLASLFAISLVTAGFGRVLAISVSPPPATNQAAPSVFISSFGGSSELDFTELYNQSNYPVDISGWQIDYVISNADGSQCGEASADLGASGWLRAKDYFTAEFASPAFSGCNAPRLARVALVDGAGNLGQSINIASAGTSPGWQHYQRNNSPNSTRLLSNDFASDYKVVDNNFTAYTDNLYQPPSDSGGLQVVEILPRSASCSPLDTSPACNDYIKLYNAGSAIAPATYAVAYKSTSSTKVSSITLATPLASGDYALVNADDSGSSISLTDAGGYVWLADAGNVKIYSPVIEYPSASSDSKIGAGWALATDGSWQWTTTPNPLGQNIVTALPASIASSSSSSLVPCADNQYRNPETNRCNLIVTASTLVDCLPTQYRNPATNRCNNLASNTSSLVACAANQVRNPATNRCKATKTATSSLTPCQPGTTRNPETNRCRKTSGVKGASTIKDVKSPSSASHTGWIVAAIVVAIALGYAAYEWRQEIFDTFRRLKLHR